MFRLEKLFGIVICCKLLQVLRSEEIRKESALAATEDYCMLEAFQPRCLKNEVILMRSATYGRMHVGRCITAEEVAAFGNDPRYFGCSANVLSILDEKCSGKKECDIRHLDISNENIKPCFPGLNVYLEVSYECISVADEERSCAVTASVVPTHIIGSTVKSSRVCGTQSQPWTVEAPVGQKIRISLFDLNALKPDKTQSCSSYGVIWDKTRSRNVSICAGGEQREKELQLSTGNAVEIFLHQDEQKKNNGSGKQFVLKLEAVGCLDLIPPEDAWLKRNDDSIVIGCYSSRKTWHLHCEGEKWIGVFGNCSEAYDTAEEPQLRTDKGRDAQILTMVGIGGLTVLLCLAVLCTGIVCLRKFSAQDKNQDYKTLYFHVDSAQSQHVERPIQFRTSSAIAENVTYLAETK